MHKRVKKVFRLVLAKAILEDYTDLIDPAVTNTKGYDYDQCIAHYRKLRIHRYQEIQRKKQKARGKNPAPEPEQFRKWSEGTRSSHTSMGYDDPVSLGFRLMPGVFPRKPTADNP